MLLQMRFALFCTLECVFKCLALFATGKAPFEGPEQRPESLKKKKIPLRHNNN